MALQGLTTTFQYGIIEETRVKGHGTQSHPYMVRPLEAQATFVKHVAQLCGQQEVFVQYKDTVVMLFTDANGVNRVIPYSANIMSLPQINQVRRHTNRVGESSLEVQTVVDLLMMAYIADEYHEQCDLLSKAIEKMAKFADDLTQKAKRLAKAENRPLKAEEIVLDEFAISELYMYAAALRTPSTLEGASQEFGIRVIKKLLNIIEVSEHAQEQFNALDGLIPMLKADASQMKADWFAEIAYEINMQQAATAPLTKWEEEYEELFV